MNSLGEVLLSRSVNIMKQTLIILISLLSLGLASCSQNVFSNKGDQGFLGSLIGNDNESKTASETSKKPKKITQNTYTGSTSRATAAKKPVKVAARQPRKVSKGPKVVLGGITDNAIGKSLGSDDLKAASAAEFQALEHGKTGVASPWRNPTNGRYGNVVASRPFKQRNIYCRQFTHTIYVDGTPKIMRGIACRNKDGSWQNLG